MYVTVRIVWDNNFWYTNFKYGFIIAYNKANPSSDTNSFAFVMDESISNLESLFKVEIAEIDNLNKLVYKNYEEEQVDCKIGFGCDDRVVEFMAIKKSLAITNYKHYSNKYYWHNKQAACYSFANYFSCFKALIIDQERNLSDFRNLFKD